MSVIEPAADWMMGIFAGPFTVMLMTIAVACFGISMLAGHLSARRGLLLVLGCFIFTGSAQIAGSLMGSISRRDAVPALPRIDPIEIAELPPLGPEPAPLAPNGNPFDPYAGAKPVQ
ncbi:MAG: TrbC/VirB2 family protein [Erythrobacter sp.]|nr:TrbC/VirB2 family protein [Erythrobacter sp.]MDZ4272686.1 TrbC/VirB2 family protein [Erythrobacter sp.]